MGSDPIDFLYLLVEMLLLLELLIDKLKDQRFTCLLSLLALISSLLDCVR